MESSGTCCTGPWGPEGSGGGRGGFFALRWRCAVSAEAKPPRHRTAIKIHHENFNPVGIPTPPGRTSAIAGDTAGYRYRNSSTGSRLRLNKELAAMMAYQME